jgi:hypothetical protein
MADDRTSPSTSRALWWLLLVLVIGACAALVGVSAELSPVWVAIAAGAIAAVLPPYLDERLRRRALPGRRRR